MTRSIRTCNTYSRYKELAAVIFVDGSVYHPQSGTAQRTNADAHALLKVLCGPHSITDGCPFAKTVDLLTFPLIDGKRIEERLQLVGILYCSGSPAITDTTYTAFAAM